MRGGAPILLGARPVKEEERRQVPASSLGDRLRPGVERGICTDALMPGQTVREDDRPMCRYAYGSSEDRFAIPERGVTATTAPARGSVPQRRVALPDEVAELAPAALLGDERGGQRVLGHPLYVVPGPAERRRHVGDLAAGRDPAHQPVVG